MPVPPLVRCGSGRKYEVKMMSENQNKIAPSALIAKESVIVGDVTIGEASSVFYFAALRGDEAPITIGSRTNIQENCTVHVDADAPVSIGDNVTIGHNCVIHGCEIGSGSLIGMGSVILNGAKIGRNCLIGAGSLITQNTEIPNGMLALGSPAKVKRPLTPEELASLTQSADNYVKLASRLFS